MHLLNYLFSLLINNKGRLRGSLPPALAEGAVVPCLGTASLPSGSLDAARRRRCVHWRFPVEEHLGRFPSRNYEGVFMQQRMEPGAARGAVGRFPRRISQQRVPSVLHRRRLGPADSTSATASESVPDGAFPVGRRRLYHRGFGWACRRHTFRHGLQVQAYSAHRCWGCYSLVSCKRW